MVDDLSFTLLSGPAHLPRTLDRDALAEAYRWPTAPTVRANFIATLDGTVTGPDGRSGSLGTPADRMVFELLRRTCDVIVVGAGTARVEEYGAPPRGTPLVVVSRRGILPERLWQSRDVVLATSSLAGRELERARRALGDDQVWVLGESDVDAVLLRDRLLERGHTRILHEGGPVLATQWFRAGCVDELCLTTVPRIGLAGPRLVHADGVAVHLRPRLLLKESDTLLGCWSVVRGLPGDPLETRADA